MNGILKKIFSYLIVKILTFDILINLKYYIFRDYFRDIGKFSTSKKLNSDLKIAEAESWLGLF